MLKQGSSRQAGRRTDAGPRGFAVACDGGLPLQEACGTMGGVSRQAAARHGNPGRPEARRQPGAL